jgi:hypothetical protein
VALATAAKDPALPSLLDVARQLGYTNTNRLREADLELCDKIQARFRDSDRFYRVRGYDDADIALHTMTAAI